MGTLSKLQVHKPDLKILGMLYDVETGWVLECDKFKELNSTKDFREHYKTILREKQYQFTIFSETNKDDIITTGDLDKTKIEKESAEVLKTIINNEEEELTELQNQKLSIPTILTQVQVPKINFVGVKINIPKIYSKKKGNT
jgi:hypothetical protein